MRIVLLNQYYAPDEAATAQLLSDVGSALADAGHSVFAVCCNRSYVDPSRSYSRQENVAGVHVLRTPVTSLGRRSMIARAVDALLFMIGAIVRLLTVERPDVIVSLTTPPMIGLIGAAVARIRGARAVLWSMDVYPEVAYELGHVRRRSIFGRVLQFVASRTLRSQDAVVALGDAMADRLRTHGAKRVAVIHNWYDEAVTADRAATHAIRERWKVADRFVVAYSGNLGLAHEFDTVIDAASALARDGSIVFVFVASGPRFAEVRRRCRQLGLENVVFHDPVARDVLSESLAAADVHLVTLRPGMPGLVVPSKIYGILAAGKPTLYVGPVAGEVFEIVSAGSGTRVANGDVDALVRAIITYRDDPRRREAEGMRARQLFEQRFTKRRGIDQWQQLLQTLRFSPGER